MGQGTQTTGAMMEVHPDLSKVTEFTAIDHDITEDIAEIRALHDEAKSFLLSHKWCKEIKRSYVGFVHPGIIGVFLFNFSPARNDVDEWVWVIVGDVPPAYITCERLQNPAAALNGYIGAMEEWVEAVKVGKSVTGLIPVNVPPTANFSERLKKRLKFLDERILSQYKGDLVKK